jgi:hypothetical protein
LTTHVHPAGACTTSVWAPVVVCALTDWPLAPVSLIAGVPEADDPDGAIDTWNDGPEAGAGVQLKAQPMLQLAALVVNAGLVQLPCICVGPRRTRAGPAAAAGGVVVEPLAAAVVVVVEPPEAVVVVEPLDAAVVVVVAVLDVGNLYAGASDDWDEVDPPVVPLSQNPNRVATTTATAICHVFQARRSLIWSSPGAGHGSLPFASYPASPAAISVPLLDWGGRSDIP